MKMNDNIANMANIINPNHKDGNDGKISIKSDDGLPNVGFEDFGKDVLNMVSQMTGNKKLPNSNYHTSSRAADLANNSCNLIWHELSLFKMLHDFNRNLYDSLYSDEGIRCFAKQLKCDYDDVGDIFNGALKNVEAKVKESKLITYELLMAWLDKKEKIIIDFINHESKIVPQSDMFSAARLFLNIITSIKSRAKQRFMSHYNISELDSSLDQAKDVTKKVWNV